MHHFAFGINFQIHFVSLVSPVSTHLTYLYEPIFVIIATLIMQHLFIFFTIGSKPTFSTHASHLNFTSLRYLPRSSVYCLVFFSFTFWFIPCGRLSWLAFYCTLNTHYRIVSYLRENRVSFSTFDGVEWTRRMTDSSHKSV